MMSQNPPPPPIHARWSPPLFPAIFAATVALVFLLASYVEYGGIPPFAGICIFLWILMFVTCYGCSLCCYLIRTSDQHTDMEALVMTSPRVSEAKIEVETVSDPSNNSSAVVNNNKLATKTV